MEILTITIIGIYDQKPAFSLEITKKLLETRHFAGGKRHYDLVKKHLPANANWTHITVPLDTLVKTIAAQEGHWVIFASGDPLFFGIGNTLTRKFPQARFEFFPAFNSLQLLGHRFNINYGNFTTVSLTGRPWHEFDKALIRGNQRLGILTDRKKTPATIASRMLKYGYHNYRVYYGECLGGKNERIARLTLQELQSLEFSHPNCFFLEKRDETLPQRGIPDQDFEILEGRPRMITKMAVRLTTLAALELHNKKLFWDIGACTGSISIEVRLHFPHVKVMAFEKREESREIIQQNARKFKAPGIEFFGRNYLDVEKNPSDTPDAVFLGGYAGAMEQILDDVDLRLTPGGTLVFNSVSHESKTRFLNWGEKHCYTTHFHQVMSVENHNPITVIALKKPHRS